MIANKVDDIVWNVEQTNLTLYQLQTTDLYMAKAKCLSKEFDVELIGLDENFINISHYYRVSIGPSEAFTKNNDAGYSFLSRVAEILAFYQRTVLSDQVIKSKGVLSAHAKSVTVPMPDRIKRLISALPIVPTKDKDLIIGAFKKHIKI